jgi:NTE family protein
MKRRATLAALGMGVGALLSGCSLGPRGDEADLDTPAQKPSPGTYPVAWVLSSGGPRGFVHVGVIKALHELGLKPTWWWAARLARWWAACWRPV